MGIQTTPPKKYLEDKIESLDIAMSATINRRTMLSLNNQKQHYIKIYTRHYGEYTPTLYYDEDKKTEHKN